MAEEEKIPEEKIPEDNATTETAENEPFVPKKREPMTMDDLDGSNKYIDLKMGTTVEMMTQRIEKVQDDKYCLSNSQNADGKTYKIEITDVDGQILSVTTWKLWNMIRVAFKDLNVLAPVQLRIKHPGHGQYGVEYLKEGKWIVVPEPEIKAT